MPRSFLAKKSKLISAYKHFCYRFSRDYLLQPSVNSKAIAIGNKNDDKETKAEKKEKKIKDMSDSRKKKFQKLFGEQVTKEEKLINYFR